MLNFIMPSVIMLRVIMSSVIKLSFLAHPVYCIKSFFNDEKKFYKIVHRSDISLRLVCFRQVGLSQHKCTSSRYYTNLGRS